MPTLDRPAARHSRIVVSAAVLVSCLVWWAWFGANWRIFLTLGPAGPGALLLFAVVAALLAFLPPVRRLAQLVHDRLKNPTATTRRLMAVVIAIVSTTYLAWTAFSQHRPRFPIVHDEFSYLIGAQMLARGRLWM